MPLLEKPENGEQVLVKNENYLQILKNKDQRKRLVHEICTFLDSSQSVQEIDALRTENRKLKNANSRLRYKTKDWALKKEEYENEIERLSGEISNYLNVTNFWYEESELLGGQEKRTLSEQRKHASTQTEGAFGLEKSLQREALPEGCKEWQNCMAEAACQLYVIQSAPILPDLFTHTSKAANARAHQRKSGHYKTVETQTGDDVSSYILEDSLSQGEFE